MKINHGRHGLATLMLAILGMVSAANAAKVTATTDAFRLSIRHNDTWYPRTAAASEAISYSTEWTTNALEDANAVVKVYPVKREKPKYIAIDLSGGTSATHYSIEYFEDVPVGGWTDEYKTSKLVLRHIPAGSFVAGGRETDYPGAENAGLHMVSVTKDFYIGVFEVTQRQWELVMGNNPSQFTNGLYYAARPVDTVSYNDIRGAALGANWPGSFSVDNDSFVGVLRKKTSLCGFDLPTAAQWEMASRAGTTTSLNTGVNLSSEMACEELEEVARYGNNSGWWEQSKTWSEMFSNGDLHVGTAKVGSYTPNAFGLYDMHGNVWERVLDWGWGQDESIDPVGAESGTTRVCKGGAWSSGKGYYLCQGRASSDRPDFAGHGNGFRLCLQGGDIPEVAEGVTLVNSAGEGTANWTPTKAGTYYLTHETQTNGVNGAEVLGAWFEVAGPELTIEPQGELTNGVAIAINGAGDGWTVYYTTDGSEPTSSSTLYEGAFSLPDSATVRAVAISAGGVSSDEATVSLTLHSPLSVNGVVARQRWPWNGMVDIDATVAGDPSKNYIVTLTALHTDGGTNLPIRTAWVDGGSATNDTFVLAPGQYRFTWNADADIAGDFNFGEVEFGVSVTGGALTDYAKKLTLTVDGYTGTETLTNVPVLVRLSTAISGFSYADFADANGGDMVFCDEGESVIYPHEIDEWHTDGESLVWVKLPQMAHGTKFKMAYGGALGDRALPSHSVWNDYAGVWHFNEDSGAAFDSTAHGLDALPSCGTNEFADVSQMVAYENGACGRARVNMATMPTADNGWMRFANYMIVPSYDGLCLRSRFSVSGWVYGNVNMANPRFVSRKNGNWDECGWEVIFGNNSNPSMNNTTLVVHGAGDSVSDKLIKDVCAEISDISEGWVFLVCLFDGETAYCYNNGVLVSQGAISPATDNGLPLLFGQKGNGTSTGYNGQYDEIRLRGGLLSADRIKADYDMIANRDFISFAAASNEGGSMLSVSATAVATLDIRHDGIRDSLGDETLTYSSLWDGGDGATVTIAQDGVAIAEGLTGEGERAWSVTRNGTYVLTHTTYTNGVAGEVETATFVVTGKDVPFAEGDVTVSGYEAKYDGAAHGIDVTVVDGIAGAVVKYATAVDGAFAATEPTLTDVGSMTVWCEIAAPGYTTQTNSATVTITKRAVTLTSGDASKVYDGTALVKHEVAVSGDGFVNGEGANYEYAGSQTNVGTSENAFTYTMNEGTKAGNYDIITANGTLTVTKASAGGGSGGEEPGGGEVPTGGESKFDATVMYDGEGHTIDTNALAVAFGNAVIGEFAVEYAEDDGSGNGGPGVPALPWGAVPVYTNAGEYVVWYRVSNPNYNDFIHAAKVTITNRPVTVTSADGNWTYDGQPHSSATVSTEGFVDGEGVVASNFATITGVGSVANAFDYAFSDGTLADNYAVTCVTGTLTIVAATIHYVADNVTGEYNGTGYGIDVSVSAPASGAAVKFAESAEGPWLDSLAYIDVCEERPIYFQVSATGYTTAVDSRTVTVTPKTLTEDYVWLVLPWEDYVYDGTAKEPEFTCGDGEPSIITLDDFDVSYLDNIDAGTATAVFTGKGNYTGTVTEEFDIWPREVTFTSGSASKVYDGTVLVKHEVAASGDGFIDGEGVTFDVTGSQTNVGASENAFTYTLNEGTKASNYDISTVNGTLTVTKASAGGEGGEEPGGGEVPTGGESKFDTTFMYDGEGHTIDTDALTVAFIDAVIGEIAVEYAADDGGGNGGPGVPALPWGTVPVYTNAGEYVVWYRVSNPNYEDFVHAAKVTITNRPVTVTSADGSWTYDGQAHSNATVTAEGFVDGEGIVANNFATIADVGSSANSFGYVFADGTLAENYLVTCVTGTLTVAAAGMDGWTDDAKWSVSLAGDGAKYDGTEKTCAVTALAYDGFAIPTFTAAGNTATDAGDYTLTVTGTGNFSGSHTFPWSIVKRAVTLTSGDASKVYDGIALTNHTVSVSGDGFIDGEGASYNFTGSQTDVGSSANAFTYTLNEGTKAGNYDITTANGTLTVTKATVGPGGGDEPGGGEVPTGGESKFDVTTMYDGEGHTIDTNALTAAFGAAMIGEFSCMYARAQDQSSATPPTAGWGADAPAYTNAGEYVVWYRVTNPNYEDFIHAAKVTITNRPVTVTSADGSWTYDGQAHSNATVTTEGFVDGEGIVASNFATITDVGSSANSFDYAFADGTLADNYAVTCVTGTLTVVAAGMDGWTDDAKWSVTLAGDGVKYDGTEKTCEVTALAYDGFAIPTFTVAGNTATDAGGYTLTVTGTGNFSGSHTFPWSIVKRAVTLTSGDASKVYDGIALTNHTVSVSGDGFASGEGASCEYTGSQTNVGTSENTFAYMLNDGTKAGNYDISTVNGTLTVTRASINPTEVFGGEGTGDNPLVCEKVFNGAQQPVEIVPNFDEPYQFLWALTEGNENAYSATAPTLRNVADGELTVFFKFVTENYEPYYGKVVFQILAKELTDEMVVLSDEAFYYDPGSTVKKPSVTVADTNALGEVISTANDYTVAYENATAAGAIPVTVTAKNNYTGTVTKTFPVLKRPVAPPVIGTKAYNGRTQKATVTSDSRWTVVRNNGGVDVGEYEVVLRLTNTEDYRWKGVDEAEAEWTGVFRITKANNGWSRKPGITGWTYGETPNEPVMGQARYGTVQVAYRRKGTDVSTETATKPSTPGTYIARFWVDETENHIGVALSTPYEVEFEIAPGAGGFTETQTTPVPVPYVWLDPYLTKYGSGDYEAAGHATGANGCALWESYVAGLDPENPTSKLRAFIEMLSDNTPKVTWSPDLSNADVPRTYTILGKAKLTDADWTPVTDANKPMMRFFKVKVEMK